MITPLKTPFPIPKELEALLLTKIPDCFFVGGCVRDFLLGKSPKDCDVEVYHWTYDQLTQLLAHSGRVDLVGKSFGVVKFTTKTGKTYDVSIARREHKTLGGTGHKAFEINLDSDVTSHEGAERRDFTINAMMVDPKSNSLHDYFGGLTDLNARILRHTSDQFPDDPLRVLRLFQFAGRFDMTAAPETLDLCRSLVDEYSTLSIERVREEWGKWATHSTRPSRGLDVLQATGWIQHYRALSAMLQTPQDPIYHPEGADEFGQSKPDSVWIHTKHCCDALARLPQWQNLHEEDRLVYMLATLCHDMGKPSCTSREFKARENRVCIISPGHDLVGGPIARQFLQEIGMPISIIERVVPLVENHMAHLNSGGPASIRRLAKRLEPENITGLALVMIADHFGRPPEPEIEPASIRTLLEKAADLRVQDSAPQPILLGRHLISLGMTPSPLFGKILSAAYEKQLNGDIQSQEEAISWLKAQYSSASFQS